MKRLGLGLALLLIGCTGCATVIVNHFRAPAPKPTYGRHAVRILWMPDSVLSLLQPAALDTMETVFQVTSLQYGELEGWPGDTGYVVTGVVECPAHTRDLYTVWGDCPNDSAPTIHVHVSRSAHLGNVGNNCTPSRQDLTLQARKHHLFDAIICGVNTRPMPYFYAHNPLLGTDAFPDTANPAGPSMIVKRPTA